MSYPVEHKTVFVLDKGPLFARSCKQSIEYDVMSKTKTPGIIPAAPITKSMWTCNVETMIEYMRIVFDIFPCRRLIRVVVGDETLSVWQQKDQNIQQVMLALGQVGPPGPKTKDEENVIRGLTEAVRALCDPTDLQQEIDRDVIQNKGRIICLTAVKSESQMRAFEECVSDAILQHNQLAEDSESLLPISHCELVLVHVTPVGDDSKITERRNREISPLLYGEVYVTQSGKLLYNRLMQLVQVHYGLSSTTVTGIPMKEEQNASSSANYDVELLHPSQAHDDIMKSAHSDGLVIPSKEGLPTETVTLKWCTPKSNVVELQYCTCAARITPVDVNSRPSSCLTNFLLSGRAVMLEQPRKSGTKVISHMLASHGGEIFIHSINTARSLLEDPPSISEGCGGRVTDYRINDFKEFMKENRLAPALPDMMTAGVNHLNRAKVHLERMSRFWPLVIGETIIFNMASHIDPLPTIIVKEKLDDEDVLECQKAIYHVVGMESRNEPLPTSSAGPRGKGPKRDEQYKQMWAELESLIRAHADTSPQHQRVLECLLKCKKPTDDAKSSPKKAKEEKMEVESNTEQSYAWKELEKFQKMTEKEKQELNKTESGASATKKSRLSTDETQFKTKGAGSLLSLWTDRIKTVHSKRHVEFTGRSQSDGNQAELYQNLNKQLQENAGMEGSVPTQKGTGIQKKM
ncbi:integrator complex subunit 13-like [Ostrea edulis]|uniref:integrator complex subunit 13-like n=1 Tax=Ostrea edulis TaxID=37623 RepID=UPI002095264A|nr:integrator complex subunit 13-like [Ostrea edulis]